MRCKLQFLIILLCCMFFSSCNRPAEDKTPKGQKEYLQACQLLREGKIQEAKELLLKITQDYPDSPVALQANTKLDEIEKNSNAKGMQPTPAKDEKVPSVPVIPPHNVSSDPRSVQEIRARLEYVNARMEERSGNVEKAQSLYERIQFIYPLTVAAAYAKTRQTIISARKTEPKEGNPGPTLRLYHSILGILEKQISYQEKQKELRSVSQKDVNEEMKVIHDALIDYYTELDALAKLLEEEIKDIEIQNHVHYLNSHLVRRDVEWSTDTYSKIYKKQTDQYYKHGKTSETTSSQSGINLSLKSPLQLFTGVGGGVGFGYENTKATTSAKESTEYQYQDSEQNLESRQRATYREKESTQAKDLKYETLSEKLKTSRDDTLKLMEEWRNVFVRFGIELYQNPQVQQLCTVEMKINVSVALKDWNDAEQLCQKLVALDSQAVAYKWALLKIYYFKGDYERVLHECPQYETQDTSREVYVLMGLANLKKRNFKKSLHNLKIAYDSAKNPGYLLPYSLTCAYSQTGEFTESLRFFQEAVRLGFQDYQGVKSDPDVNAKVFSHAEFKKFFEQQLNLDKNNLEIENQKTLLEKLLQEQNYSQAREILEREGEKTFPKDVLANFSCRIYLPLVEEVTKEFENLIQKKAPQAIEKKKEALDLLSKISTPTNPGKEKIAQLKTKLTADYYYDYCPDNNLYKLEYPFEWKIKTDDRKAIKCKSQDEKSSLIIGVLAYETRLSFMTEEELEQAFNALKQKVEIIERKGKIVFSSTKEEKFMFKGVPARGCPFEFVAEKKVHYSGYARLVHYGEYLFFITARYDSSNDTHRQQIESTLEKLEFLKKPIFRKPMLLEVAATDELSKKGGLKIKEGDTVEINITGKWKVGGNWRPHGPEGSSEHSNFGDYRVLKGSATLGSLLCLVVDKNGNLICDEINKSVWKFTAPSDVTLRFCINDSGKGDNSGSLILNIRHFPKKTQ